MRAPKKRKTPVEGNCNRSELKHKRRRDAFELVELSSDNESESSSGGSGNNNASFNKSSSGAGAAAFIHWLQSTSFHCCLCPEKFDDYSRGLKHLTATHKVDTGKGVGTVL